MQAAGLISKMAIRPSSTNIAQYELVLGNERVGLNALLGRQVRLQYAGAIHCCNCNKRTKTSFGQGYCYPCFIKLAECDSCMMSPEKCHYQQGTCRDEKFAEDVCFSDHIVYLANSSGLKVGITRSTQMPTRWLDQGAIQALPIARVKERRLSGYIEDLLRQDVADKTSWQKLLKGDAPLINLNDARDRLFERFAPELKGLQQTHGPLNIQLLENAGNFEFSYPVEQYPSKIVSLNFDKEAVVSGRLMGLKGQYLLLDSGVINLRKFTSYQVSFAVTD